MKITPLIYWSICVFLAFGAVLIDRNWEAFVAASLVIATFKEE